MTKKKKSKLAGMVDRLYKLSMMLLLLPVMLVAIIASPLLYILSDLSLKQVIKMVDSVFRSKVLK